MAWFACADYIQVTIFPATSLDTTISGLELRYILKLKNRWKWIKSCSVKDSSRSEDFGDEVKRRILMVLLPLQRWPSRLLNTGFLQGSYALSAGHSDSYYKRAQEVFITEQQPSFPQHDFVQCLGSQYGWSWSDHKAQDVRRSIDTCCTDPSISC